MKISTLKFAPFIDCSKEEKRNISNDDIYFYNSFGRSNVLMRLPAFA